MEIGVGMEFSGSLGVRQVRLISLVAALALAMGSISLVSAPRASADGESGVAYRVCEGWLDPAWTGNYRCDAPDYASGVGLRNVFIRALERAGCVDYADVWHNLVNSWVCYPKGTELGGYTVRRDGGWYRGVIRNNNLTYKGLFSLTDLF
jgi:hypothetical protein